MRRLASLSVVALAAATLVGPVPSTDAASEVRHYLDADWFGSTAYDGSQAVGARRGIVATVGGTRGALPGHTHAGGLDAFVRVVSPDLGERWTTQIGGTEDDIARAVATDGRIVVAGGRTHSALAGPAQGSGDAWLTAFEADGDVLWSRQLGGTRADDVSDVVIAPHAVYASGHIGSRGFVHKFSLEGDLVWRGEVAGVQAPHLATRGDRLFVVQRRTTAASPPVSIAELDTTTGARRWQTSWLRNFRSSGLVTDGSQLYLTANLGFDHRVFAFTLDGERRWKTTLAGQSVDAAWDGTALIVVVQAVDGAGELVGKLVALSPRGRERWAQRLPDDLLARDATYGRRALYVAGETYLSDSGDPGASADAVTARFVTYQPDAKARVPGTGEIGDDWYGARHQRLILPIARGRTRMVDLIAQNDGEVEQTLLLGGCVGHDGYRIRYLNGSDDVSSVVTGPGLPIEQLYRGDAGIIDLAVTAGPRAKERTTCAVTVTSATTGEVDRVILDLRRR